MKDLTNYNYEDLVEKITEDYKDKTSSGNAYEGSTGQMLIELLADTTDHLHFMLERRTQESYVSTARLDSSVRAAVSSIGYRPRRKVSATGKVKISLIDDDENPVNSTGNIIIPYGKEITFDDNTFIVDGDYRIEAGESEVEVDVKEGTLKEYTANFATSPEEDDNFILFDEYVDMEEYSLQVTEQNTIYKDVYDEKKGLRVRAISFSGEGDPVYDLKYVREGMRVLFGDGTFGKKPTGDVTVSWVESSGDDTWIVDTGLEFDMEDEVLTDDVLVTPPNEYDYKITNTTPIRGGGEEETIEEMKTDLTAFIRSNDRAVTNFDHEFWVLRSGIGDIADANAYGEHETNRLIFTMNNVYVTYATNDGLDLLPEQVRQLKDYMDEVKVATTRIIFRPADKIHLGVTVDFKRHRSLPISDSQLYQVLVERINDYFKVERGIIGRGFQHSEFVEFLQNLTIDFKRITYPMTDFVKVDVIGMVPFEVPTPTYDGIISISDDYSIQPNDVWNVTIDDETFTVVTTSSDTIKGVVDQMMEKIFLGTNLMLARVDDKSIRLTHPQNTGTYEISIGSGDLSDYITFNQYISIPKPVNGFTNDDAIYTGSVDVVDESGDVLLVDDGNGNLTESSQIDVSIDYNKAVFQIPSLPEGKYYIRFQQNEFQNFGVADNGMISLMPFKKMSYTGDDHYFSSLELL